MSTELVNRILFIGWVLFHAAMLLLSGCTPKPEPDYYFLQRAETDSEGNSIVWTYSGSTPPRWPVVPKDDLPDPATVKVVK